jgi:hypothetical protein
VSTPSADRRSSGETADAFLTAIGREVRYAGCLKRLDYPYKREGDPTMTLAEIVQRGWDAVATGDMDTLAADYITDMIFIMPGQTDVLNGIPDFRAAV